MEKRSVIHAHMSNMKKRRHDVHPLSMLIITFTYIFVVASFHTYAFIELVPLSLYPITMIVFIVFLFAILNAYCSLLYHLLQL
ncbi:hypothetical protein JS44_00940 [Anoxybacillus flavithermus]|uniref:Uncharacterized protein n=1 Tax=Anoxybacillus flavithermus TaxID=33934 RepID=A0A094IZR7_9BACL|nr:hypothetical protein JS44_00940 [Anoxybacillus flavithermus]